VSTDAISAADDHIRLIKSTLLATFPNITGAMNATHTELNTVADGGTAATSTTLVDADRFVVNDDGTMVQVALSDLLTYLNTALTSAGALASIRGLTYPDTDGTAGQFLSTDGNGTLSFGSQTDFAMPPGLVFPFAGTTAPSGYQLCDGSDLNTYDYRTLHAVISGTYGGTAYEAGVTDQSGVTTTFKVPDLRGRVVAGKGSGSVIASSILAQDTLGATGGDDQITLTKEQSGLPAHGHGLSGGINTVRHGGSDIGTAVIIGNFTNDGGESGGGTVTTGNTNFDNFSVDNNSGADASSAHNNVQPTMILNYVIKY
jgi:microcystin-dependent protein